MKLTFDANPPLEEVARSFRRDQRPIIDQEIDNLATAVLVNIVREAPSRTGNLRKAIRKRKPGQMVREIHIDQRFKARKYEHFVRLGTRPHPINPKKKRALFWPGLPHPIKRVKMHPGTKPNDYWERGIEASRPDFERTAETIGKKIEVELTQ